MGPILRILLHALVLLLPWATAANAEERILEFDSRVVIRQDGNLNVTETITVEAEGRNIKRGIYRDFPTKYNGPDGRRHVVGFEILEVLRDGRPENWFTKSRSNGVRVYAGNENVFLGPGRYEYIFRYRTDRQIGFFDDYDELYWNATGNDWAFAIDRARVTVVLPPGATIVQTSAYTGREGATGQDWTSWTDSRGNAVFESTRRLAPREGLTVAVAWPKGFVPPPTVVEDAIYLSRDYIVYAVGLGGIGLILIFYLVAWDRVGRDPPEGPIVPRWRAPRGISPAIARYVTRMGFDKKALGAAVVSLAVKGHLKIEESGRGEYVLHKRTAPGQSKMSPGEKAFKRALFRWGDSTTLEKGNHERLQPAVNALKSVLSADYEGAHFSHNMWVTVVGGGLTVLVALSTVFIGVNVQDNRIAFLFPGIIVSGVLLNRLFGWLMKAPTMTGRRLMDEIEGFKMYLSTAEQERLNLLHPPDRTPELFEKYLPYAMALDVETEWGRQFEDVLAKAAADTDGGYRPRWYYGRRGHHGWSSPGRFASSLGAELSGAISSAATPPGSSSGSGGGGFSGGGGGGGGGGGW